MNVKNINSQSNSSSDEISLKELIFKIGEFRRYLVSKWWVILTFGVIGGCLGYVYAYSKKTIYTATTTFVLEDEKSAGGGVGSLASLASMAGVDLGGGAGGIFQGDNIFELYKSRKMIEKTLLTSINYKGKNELLIDRYIDINHLRERWIEKPELLNVRFDNPLNFTRLQDSIVGVIVKDIDENYLSVFKLDKKLSIIKADVKSNDESFAMNFNKQIVKNVNDFYVQTKTKKSFDNVAILQQKTDSVRSVMNGAIYKAAAIADATPNLNPTRQSQRNAPIQRSQFSAETNKAMLSALVQNLEMSKIALRKDMPLIQVIDEPILPLAKVSFGKLKGIVIGAFLMIFFITIGLILKKMIQNFTS